VDISNEDEIISSSQFYFQGAIKKNLLMRKHVQIMWKPLKNQSMDLKN
jgi:hypothetical protein